MVKFYELPYKFSHGNSSSGKVTDKFPVISEVHFSKIIFFNVSSRGVGKYEG